MIYVYSTALTNCKTTFVNLQFAPVMPRHFEWVANMREKN